LVLRREKEKEKRYLSVVVKKFYDTKEEDHRQAEFLLSSVILFVHKYGFTHKPLPRIAMVLVVASPFIVSCHNFQLSSDKYIFSSRLTNTARVEAFAIDIV